MPNHDLLDTETLLTRIDQNDYAALIYYVNRDNGDNELTVINKDFTRDVIGDSQVELAAQGLFQTLEDSVMPAQTPGKVAFIYLPSNGQTTYLHDHSANSKEAKTMAVAKAISLAAGFEALGITSVRLKHNEDFNELGLENADANELLSFSGNLGSNMATALLNAITSERFIENGQAANFLVDFTQNTLTGSFTDELMESTHPTVSKEKEQLTEEELQLFNELSKQSNINNIVVTYEGSGDSGDGYELTAYDDKGKEIDAPEELAEKVEAFASNLLEIEFPAWEIAEGADGELTMQAKTMSYVLEHQVYHRYEHTEKLDSTMSEEDVSEVMGQLLAPVLTAPSPGMSM